jgi:hypothetical protein
LNEGGAIRLGADGRARLYGVGVAEKVPLVEANGDRRPGSRSVAGRNQAVLKLISAQPIASYR